MRHSGVAARDEGNGALERPSRLDRIRPGESLVFPHGSAGREPRDHPVTVHDLLQDLVMYGQASSEAQIPTFASCLLRRGAIAGPWETNSSLRMSSATEASRRLMNSSQNLRASAFISSGCTSPL